MGLPYKELIKLAALQFEGKKKKKRQEKWKTSLVSTQQPLFGEENPINRSGQAQCSKRQVYPF